jgi:hypothetical protein
LMTIAHIFTGSFDAGIDALSVAESARGSG